VLKMGAASWVWCAGSDAADSAAQCSLRMTWQHTARRSTAHHKTPALLCKHPPEELPISISCRPSTTSCVLKAASCTHLKKADPGSGLLSPTFQVTHSTRRLCRWKVVHACSSQDALQGFG
jgi:hypothetical protein